MSTAQQLSMSLPTDDGMRPYTLGPPVAFPIDATPLRSRVAYAAAHVVCDPLADNTPGSPAQLDWDATLRYRHHLWAHGLGVADAMDTAQRGMGLNWAVTQELIRRCGAEAKTVDGLLACGAATDQLPPRAESLDQVVAAYHEQCAVVEGAGARIVLMASRQLAQLARGPEDYADVYSAVLAQVSRPVILHWLGEMFDPALRGYWGSTDLDEATEACLAIIAEHAAVIDGIKLSLLDPGREIAIRRRLPAGVRLYTGDDYNYLDLIRGDGSNHSDAFLGAFDAIAPAASAALHALDAGDVGNYEEFLAPTLPLARHLFAAPTYYYKTGITFLAYLAGHQDHFRMVGGLESARSVSHLAAVFTLADRAGLLPDPQLAAARMAALLRLAGVA
jgi:hypothetical protein